MMATVETIRTPSGSGDGNAAMGHSTLPQQRRPRVTGSRLLSIGLSGYTPSACHSHRQTGRDRVVMEPSRR